MTHQICKTHTRTSLSGVLLAAFCVSFGACSWVPKGETGLDVGIKDRGIASWYGEQFHGKQAANGELFDMMALTAAHRCHHATDFKLVSLLLHYPYTHQVAIVPMLVTLLAATRCQQPELHAVCFTTSGC